MQSPTEAIFSAEHAYKYFSGRGSARDPAGEAYRVPQPSHQYFGKGRIGEGKGWGKGKGRRREGKRKADVRM